jgi:DNA-directed RNA polymerase
MAGSQVQWTTPIGLPVVQPYFRTGVRRVMTALQTFALQLPDDHDSARVRAPEAATRISNIMHKLGCVLQSAGVIYMETWPLT